MKNYLLNHAHGIKITAEIISVTLMVVVFVFAAWNVLSNGHLNETTW